MAPGGTTKEADRRVKGQIEKRLTSQQAVFWMCLMGILIVVLVTVWIVGDSLSSEVLGFVAAALTLFGLALLAFVDIQTIWWRDDPNVDVTPKMEERLSNLRPPGHGLVLGGALIIVGIFLADAFDKPLFVAVLGFSTVVLLALAFFILLLVGYIEPETVVSGAGENSVCGPGDTPY